MNRRGDSDPRSTLVFDGDCGICTWLADRARRIDSGRRFRVVPWQDLSADDLRPWGLTPASCMEQLMLLSRDATTGRPRSWGGALAVNGFLWKQFPWSILVALIYLLPPVLLAEVIVYRWVARNRTAISRRLGLRGCRSATPGAGSSRVP